MGEYIDTSAESDCDVVDHLRGGVRQFASDHQRLSPPQAEDSDELLHRVVGVRRLSRSAFRDDVQVDRGHQRPLDF